MHPKEGDPDFVLSLARGLQVIEAFREQRDGMTVTDAAERTGLSRAAARRLLVTLEALGYADRSGAAFRLSSRILRLGFSFLTSTTLAGRAMPLLEQLSAEIHESCSVSVLDGAEIVYLARAAAKRVMTVDLGVGSRLPAYCTSMGRVLLAALPDDELERQFTAAECRKLTPKTITDRDQLREIVQKVRADGYALVDEELELGLRSVAVPVTAQSGNVVAAINSGVATARVSRRELRERILPALIDCAERLGQFV